jgi:hypothetical protein
VLQHREHEQVVEPDRLQVGADDADAPSVDEDPERSVTSM